MNWALGTQLMSIFIALLNEDFIVEQISDYIN